MRREITLKANLCNYLIIMAWNLRPNDIKNKAKWHRR